MKMKLVGPPPVPSAIVRSSIVSVGRIVVGDRARAAGPLDGDVVGRRGVDAAQGTQQDIKRFVGLDLAVVVDLDGDRLGLAGRAGESERRIVVHIVAIGGGGRAVVGGVGQIESALDVVVQGDREDEVGRSAARAFGDRQIVDREVGRIVVGDRAGAAGPLDGDVVGRRGIDTAQGTQQDIKRFVGLHLAVVVDLDGDRLGLAGGAGESERRIVVHIVAVGGGGRAVIGRVGQIESALDVVVQGDREDEVGRSAAGPFGDRDIVDRERWPYRRW